jgi:hypothetical protein
MRRHAQVEQYPVHSINADFAQQRWQFAEIAVHETHSRVFGESSPAHIQCVHILIDSNENRRRPELPENSGGMAASPQGGIDVRTTSVGD